MMKRILARVVAMSALLLAACGGSNYDDTVTTPLGSARPLITIDPDPVVVVQGSRQVVRVDVTGAGGQAPAAYEFDLDEVLSGINVTTAPCPAAVDRPGCQDWTIEPSPTAVPGNYVVSLRTVGLAAGVAGGHFALKVIASQTHRGAASEIASHRGTTLVIADGRLYASGNNEDGGLGAGYLQSDFGVNGGFDEAVPHPVDTDAFVPVRITDPSTRFSAVATSSTNSFAIDDQGRVLHWGSRRYNSAGDGIAAGAALYQLQPATVESIGAPMTAISTWGLTQLALGADNQVRTWGIHDPLPRLEMADFQSPLFDVRAIAGGNTAIVLTSYFPVPPTTGSVGVDYRSWGAPSGLPGDMVAIAYGELTGEPISATTRVPGGAPPLSIGETAFAISSDGDLWWWTPENSEFATPRLDPVFGDPFTHDVTAVTTGDDGYVFALRGRDPGLSAWRLGVDTTAQSVAPPAGTAFIKVGGNFAITNDCSPTSGSLWRIHTRGGPLRVEAVHEFGAGGLCPERTDLSPLSVTVAGAGRVVSDPPGIDCGQDSTCEQPFRRFSRVRLHMLPQPGWRLERAGCAPATVETNTDNWADVEPGLTGSCTFTFEPAPPREVRLTIRKTGFGEVAIAPQGTVCGALCRFFLTGTDVTLSASASRGFRFDGFSGDEGCSDMRVHMNTPKICEARFVELPPPSAPVDLHVSTASQNSIGLAWNAGMGLVDRYRLERSIAGGPFALIRTFDFDARAFVDMDLAANTAHTYRLTAIGPNGTSVPATLTAMTLPDDPPRPPPS